MVSHTIAMDTPFSPKISVLGSLNVDYFTKVRQLPKPGETVPASALEIRFGGKGANQALAASRQGAVVSMLGRLGKDEMGDAYLARLTDEGIGNAAVEQVDIATGSAFISVEEKGENTIVVAAGANGMVNAPYVDSQRQRITKSDVLLLQMETPLDAVKRAIEIAIEADVVIVLNPSPFMPEFPWSKLPVDYLIVNEHEASQIDEALGPDQQLLAKTLIITRGAEPTLVYSEEGDLEIPSIEVEPVDTVGAGDAFAGTFAARIARGESLENAVKHANVAGALTTLKLGAQEAIPSADDVDNI